MKHRLLICVFSFCVGSLWVDAQEINEPFNPDLSENVIVLLEKVNQIKSSDNQSAILTEQIGDLNTVEILSDPQGDVNKNIVAIAQYGNQNTGILNQIGNGQEIGIYQKGDQNIADISVKGLNIYQTVTQIGSDNYVKHDIENGSNTSIKKVMSEQIGDDNKIILLSGALDYSIIEVKQNGNNNNAELDITNAGIKTDPYQITQNGDNFNIVITKSDFYMPMKSN